MVGYVSECFLVIGKGTEKNPASYYGVAIPRIVLNQSDVLLSQLMMYINVMTNFHSRIHQKIDIDLRYGASVLWCVISHHLNSKELFRFGVSLGHQSLKTQHMFVSFKKLYKDVASCLLLEFMYHVEKLAHESVLDPHEFIQPLLLSLRQQVKQVPLPVSSLQQQEQTDLHFLIFNL